LKKIFFVIFLSLSLFGNNLSSLKAKIIQNIANIFTNKGMIKIYNTDHYFDDIFKNDKYLIKVNSYDKADLILTNNSDFFKQINNKYNLPPIISTKYEDYKKHKDLDIGAFFWQKGRPNLVLNSKIIHKRYKNIPKEYIKFLE